MTQVSCGPPSELLGLDDHSPGKALRRSVLLGCPSSAAHLGEEWVKLKGLEKDGSRGRETGLLQIRSCAPRGQCSRLLQGRDGLQEIKGARERSGHQLAALQAICVGGQGERAVAQEHFKVVGR